MAVEPVLPAIPVWSAYLAVAVGGLAGASHAARRGFDVIGVIGLAVATGLGGLLLRDVLLQKGTPVVLTDPRYLLAAAVAALLGFFFAGSIGSLKQVLLVLDGLAMGLLVGLGASAALFFGLSPVAALFLGVTTAIGGGILRDLFSGESPTVLRPGIFTGVAALIGAVVFIVLYYLGVATFWNQLATIAVVFVVRVLALWRGWESPTPIDVGDRISHAIAHTKVPSFSYHELLHRTRHRSTYADEDDDPAPAARAAPPDEEQPG